MRKYCFHLLLAVCPVLFLASCAKEGPTGPTGPAGPTFTGSINGFAHLYDQYGDEVLTGRNKVTVTLNGGGAINADSTTGAYSFTSVKTGTYYLSATCPGYGATVINTVNFISGTLNRDIRLAAIPDSFVVGMDVYPAANNLFDSLIINVLPDVNLLTRNCMVFVGNRPAVSNSPASYLLNFKVVVPATSSHVMLLIPRQDFLNIGLTSGAKVYFAAYSYVVNDQSAYEDIATGKYVYNAVHPNPAIDSALVP